MEPRLKTYYKEKVIQEMMKSMGYKNPYQVPKLVKVVLNAGIGKDNKDAKLIESIQKEMALITGQKPIITRQPLPVLAPDKDFYNPYSSSFPG